MSTKVWRNDLNPTDQPNCFSLVICAEDRVEETEDHVLILVHEDSFHGKGFMPSVRSRWGGSMHNGMTSIGEDDTVYASALEEGRRLLKQETERFNQLVQKLERPRS